MLIASAVTAARAGDEPACESAVKQAGRTHAMPPRVLGTIALVESGRASGRRTIAWPWTINVDGVGHSYRSKQEAIEAVRRFEQGGAHSIDVGCMQINLGAHPAAFASLEDAFDPARNADYAARFLRGLMQESGRLALAMTAYHSRTPSRAAEYARRILAVWPEAASFGLGPAPPDEGPLTPRFARQLAAEHDRLHNRAGQNDLATLRTTSRLVSLRGAAWPDAHR